MNSSIVRWESKRADLGEMLLCVFEHANHEPVVVSCRFFFWISHEQVVVSCRSFFFGFYFPKCIRFCRLSLKYGAPGEPSSGRTIFSMIPHFFPLVSVGPACKRQTSTFRRLHPQAVSVWVKGKQVKSVTTSSAHRPIWFPP